MPAALLLVNVLMLGVNLKILPFDPCKIHILGSNAVLI